MSDLPRVLNPDVNSGFRSLEDAVNRLLPYHVRFQQPLIANEAAGCSRFSSGKETSAYLILPVIAQQRPSHPTIGQERVVHARLLVQVCHTEEPEESDWTDHGTQRAQRSSKDCTGALDLSTVAVSHVTPLPAGSEKGHRAKAEPPPRLSLLHFLACSVAEVEAGGPGLACSRAQQWSAFCDAKSEAIVARTEKIQVCDVPSRRAILLALVNLFLKRRPPRSHRHARPLFAHASLCADCFASGLHSVAISFPSTQSSPAAEAPEISSACRRDAPQERFERALSKRRADGQTALLPDELWQVSAPRRKTRDSVLRYLLLSSTVVTADDASPSLPAGAPLRVRGGGEQEAEAADGDQRLPDENCSPAAAEASDACGGGGRGGGGPEARGAGAACGGAGSGAGGPPAGGVAEARWGARDSARGGGPGKTSSGRDAGRCRRGAAGEGRATCGAATVGGSRWAAGSSRRGEDTAGGTAAAATTSSTGGGGSATTRLSRRGAGCGGAGAGAVRGGWAATGSGDHGMAAAWRAEGRRGERSRRRAARHRRRASRCRSTTQPTASRHSCAHCPGGRARGRAGDRRIELIYTLL